jgi:hypothetical protein
MKKQIEKAKEYALSHWLMHREYIIGGVIGIVIGAIIF